MKIKEGELKIFYNVPERLNRKLDEDIETTLKKHGYSRYASGFYLTEHVRDLAFKKRVTKK